MKTSSYPSSWECFKNDFAHWWEEEDRNIEEYYAYKFMEEG